MAERHLDVTKMNLKIEEVQPFSNEKYQGFKILWSGNIGFGEYTIYKDRKEKDAEWIADSECMDNKDDKAFITELMRIFIGQLKVM